MNKIYVVLLFFSLLIANLKAQNLEFQLDTVRDCVAKTYCIDIKVKAQSGSTAFRIGTSSIFLTYNQTALQFKDYTSGSFDGSAQCVSGTSSAWAIHKSDGGSSTGEMHISLSLEDDANSCPLIDDVTEILVGTLCFDIIQQGGNPEIRFDLSNTHINSDSPNNGSSLVTISAIDSIIAPTLLACDCPGEGAPCDDNNVYTVNDTFNINCGCIGEYVDIDGDNAWDGVDACIEEIYEAEDAQTYGAVFENSDMLFTGNGYMDFQDSTGEYLYWNLNLADSGSYDLGFRYALSWGNRPMIVTIDDVVTHASLDFPSTGSWSVWDTITITQNFTAGSHSIHITPSSSGNSSGANYDHLLVSFCSACTTAGTPCNDSDTCTVLDVYDTSCNCGGLYEDSDGDGICNVLDICPNGDDNQDADGDGIPDFCDSCDNNLIGTACDDGNPCTINDTIDTNCTCVGTFSGVDSDSDGVCDAYDLCPGGDDNLDMDFDSIPDFCDTCDNRTVGMPCSDGNPCTVLDVIQSDCSCFGIPIPLDIHETVSDLTCNGDDDGSITLSISGTMGNLYYTWNTGDSTAILDSLPPGMYSVSVTDVRGCTATESFTIIEPPLFTISDTAVMSSGMDGSIDLMPVGGITPYTFFWKDSIYTEDRDSLVSATYTVTATDTWGCPQILERNIFPTNMCIDTFYDAEDAIIHSNSRVRQDDTSSAIGYEYVDFRGDTTEFMEFTIDIPQCGLYTLAFRYAHAWGTRRHEIHIDGVLKFTDWELPKTYNYFNWDSKSFTHGFLKGQHTVRIRQQQQWGANIDLLSVCLAQPALEINPKVALFQPDTAGLMRDDLRFAQLLPYAEPYKVLGYQIVGGIGDEKVDSTVFTTIGADAIVDWMFVELRDKDTASLIRETRSVLLQRDGDVVDLDGISPVQFPNSTADFYYVALRHRNHLGIMTADSIALDSNPLSLDFTSPMLPVYGTNARQDLGNGVMGMWGGDATLDGKATFQGLNSDVETIQIQVLNDPLNMDNEFSFPSVGYLLTDFNMDGKTIYQGANSDVIFVSNPVFSNILNVTFDPAMPMEEQLP